MCKLVGTFAGEHDVSGFFHDEACHSGGGGNVFEACYCTITEGAPIDNGGVYFYFAFGVGIAPITHAFDFGVAFGHFDTCNHGIEGGAA